MKTPYHILHIPQLGLQERVLLAHIRSFGLKGCWQSNATLAETLMVSVPMIRRLLGRLKDYLHVSNPRAYRRTIWAKEVLKNGQVPAQRRTSQLRKSANMPAQACATTNISTIRDDYGRTIASPAPLPAGGQAPATLKESTRRDIAVIEHFKATFGWPKARDYRPLTPEQFESRRAAVLADLSNPNPTAKLEAKSETNKKT